MKRDNLERARRLVSFIEEKENKLESLSHKNFKRIEFRVCGTDIKGYQSDYWFSGILPDEMIVGMIRVQLKKEIEEHKEELESL